MNEKTMLQRLEAGEPYIANDPDLDEKSDAALDLANAYNSTTMRQAPLQREILKSLLGHIGETSRIRPPLYVDFGSKITIGEEVFINFNFMALDVAPITIGDHVLIGPNVQLLTPTHPIDPETRKQGWESAEPITIKDNVWLGGGAIVCPGVTIGENTVVGAGAVVTKDLPANVVAVGNPAKVIREITDDDRQ